MLYIQGLYIQGVVYSRCCTSKLLYIHVLYIQGVVYSFVVHPRCCTSLVVHSRCCTNEVAPPTSACAFLCAVFQTKFTISQWLLSELFFGQISGSCVKKFSILPICAMCTSHSPSSRYSQDSPGSATAGAAQD